MVSWVGLEDWSWGKLREWQVGRVTLPGTQPRCHPSHQSSLSGQVWDQQFLSVPKQPRPVCRLYWESLPNGSHVCFTHSCGLWWGGCPTFNLAVIKKSEWRDTARQAEHGIVTPSNLLDNTVLWQLPADEEKQTHVY